MSQHSPLILDCPGCSHRFEVSGPESGNVADKSVNCPQCGRSVPLPSADDRRHRDTITDDALLATRSARTRTISEMPTAARPSQTHRKSSPLGIVVAVALGGLTVFGVYALLPEFTIQVRWGDADGNSNGPPADVTAPAPPRDPAHDRQDNSSPERVELPLPTPSDTEPAPPEKSETKSATQKQPPLPKPKPPSPEELAKRAAGKLRLAKILLKRGEESDAKRRLRAIVKDYPDTKAAEEAKLLLERL